MQNFSYLITSKTQDLKRILTQFLILFVVLTIFSGCATSKLGRSGQKKMNNKTFVIVGASSGFGRGVAEELGKYKANVVLAARRGDLLEEIASTIRSSGGTALAVQTDISKPEEVERLAEAALKQYGKIDVWINMAGVGAIGRFWEIPVADQARIVDVNLTGFIYGCHSAVRIFTKQGYGTLINMGSIESENPLAYHASYAATKGGVLNLGRAINEELRLSGYKKVKVVTVEPWAVDTPFWGHSANYSGGTPRMAAMDPPSKVRSCRSAGRQKVRGTPTTSSPTSLNVFRPASSIATRSKRLPRHLLHPVPCTNPCPAAGVLMTA